MARVKANLVGKEFGRLLVTQSAGQDKNRCAMWKCRCKCGTRVTVYGSDLKKGHTQSCGCLQRERTGDANRKHGMSTSAIYRVWCEMRSRCERTTHSDYANYGAKGVMVCQRWQDFETFLSDVGPRPSSRHSVDRYPDPAGNYEPGNFRWATQTQQMNNLRVPRRLFEGKTQVEWAVFYGVTQATISRRIKAHGTVHKKEKLS